MIDAFQEKYPYITVKYEGGGLGTSEYVQLQQVKMLSGEGIDVTALRPETIKEYVDAGYLADITNESFMKSYKEDFVDLVKYDDKAYSIPYTLDIVGTIYNKTMFEENGWTLPTNRVEYVELCNEIKKAGITPTIQSYKDAWPILLDVMPFLQNIYSSDPMIFEKLNSGEVKYTDDVFVNAFKEIEAYYKSGAVTEQSMGITYDQAAVEFGLGKAAMCIHGEWMMSSILDVEPEFEIGVMPSFSNLPEEELVAPVSIGQSIGMTTFSKHPEEAKLLLEFISSPEAAKFLADTKSNFTPVDGVESETMELWKDLFDLKAEDFYYNRQLPAAQNEMTKQLQLLFMGETTAQEVANAVQEVQESGVQE